MSKLPVTLNQTCGYGGMALMVTGILCGLVGFAPPLLPLLVIGAGFVWVAVLTDRR